MQFGIKQISQSLHSVNVEIQKQHPFLKGEYRTEFQESEAQKNRSVKGMDFGET